MLWEIAITPKGRDAELGRVEGEYALLGYPPPAGGEVLLGTERGYLLEGALSQEQAVLLANELLADPLVEDWVVNPLPFVPERPPAVEMWTVLLKPGVMDPAAQSVLAAAKNLDIPLDSVRTFRRYALGDDLSPEARAGLRKVLANDAIEQVIVGPLQLEHLTLGRGYDFCLVTVPLRELDDAGLLKVSRDGQLALNLAEMHAIRDHFRELGRDPTDVELETVAQTWSEHCSHKTLKGKIDFNGRRINNLLKETIFGATQEIRRRLGPDDWCVSVFEDNAGVVKFDEKFNVCFKVETHNRPSAIEPYGGANTGIGGVIRDPLGTGLGAKPICNTDVFCFAPPDIVSRGPWDVEGGAGSVTGGAGSVEGRGDSAARSGAGETRSVTSPASGAPASPVTHHAPRTTHHAPPELPPGVLHPRKIMTGVVSGVRDYGNRMGIPTVNGAVLFDRRYLGNPLVYCGTVGVIPVDCCHKEPKAGDLIVAVGGRTGRDGIHGATFSSAELTAESEQVSGGAVQIGNAITEKKVLDVILQARDRRLYNAITDCGAGGFSSAVGEMGEKIGAKVWLDRAPLKYEGLSYTEVWISEAQERMILAVPRAKWEALEQLCASEDVEATIIGEFEATGQLRLFYRDQPVGELSMHFLHDGRPDVVRQAVWGEQADSPRVQGEGGKTSPHSPHQERFGGEGATPEDFTATLKKILGSWNVCSKEWVVRQYDHEVQGRTAVKPLVGLHEDGPGDASVVVPVLGSHAALAVGCGICPQLGDLDPYEMAANAIDEAVRNVVAVGADPARIALLDNFSWGNTDRPEVLGSLVRAAEACRDVALAYTMPFISGKDSLKNEFHAGDVHIVIPPTLLISALGRVPDVRRCVTMDLKEPGNHLYLVGTTRDEMAGTHYHLVHGLVGGAVPRVDQSSAPKLFHALHRAIRDGLVRSCHDLSEGGLAVAVAEMAFAGGVGADVTELADVAPEASDVVRLFSESPTRFVVEVRPNLAAAFMQALQGVPITHLGQTQAVPRLRIGHGRGEWLIDADLADLKEEWQKPLRW